MSTEKVEEEVKTLDDVKSMAELPVIDLSDGGDFLLSININGTDIVEECGIGEEDLRKILAIIGYGSIGWEKYNVV